MDTATAAGLCGLGGYLVGSIPFAWLAVRTLRGTDLRTVGSGNVGATNASRVLGKRWFPVLFLLDALKGAGAVLAATAWHPPGTAVDTLRAVAALGAIVGHVFPFVLGFRGGKAVATGAGAMTALSPVAVAGGFVAFLLGFVPTRWISLGSMCAAVGSVAAWHLFDPGGSAATTVFLWVLAVVVLVKHRSNLRRMIAGTEPRVGGSTAASEPAATVEDEEDTAP